jgi:hypothetical protein
MAAKGKCSGRSGAYVTRNGVDLFAYDQAVHTFRTGRWPHPLPAEIERKSSALRTKRNRQPGVFWLVA